MLPEHWGTTNLAKMAVDSYGKITKTTGSGWDAWIQSGELTVATTGGDNITIDVDTATATYDNPTDADWQYKALGYNLDETSCDTTGTDPCGFKATAEINVSALGDSTQVVVLQDDDADAPQDSTEVATAATNYKSNNPDMIASEWTHTGNGNLAVDENCYGGGNTGGGWADGGFGCVGMNTGWGSSVNGNEWLIHDLGFTASNDWVLEWTSVCETQIVN
jgi:hypothetical protein